MVISNSIFNFHTFPSQTWTEQTLLILKQYFHLVDHQNIKDYFYEEKVLKNACHITIDDGDLSVLNNLFPVIVKHQIPISIFVSPKITVNQTNFWFQEVNELNPRIFFDFVSNKLSLNSNFENKSQLLSIIKSLEVKNILDLIHQFKYENNIPDIGRKNLNVEELRELNKSKLIHIGAHTNNHPILNNESSETAEKEIKNSIEELSDLLNTRIDSFAYPNGIPNLDFSAREIEILKKSGIKTAFSTQQKRFSKRDNPLAIPRYSISKGGKLTVSAKIILGKHWENIRKLKKRKNEIYFRNLNNF